MNPNINKISKYVYKLRNNFNKPDDLLKYFEHFDLHINLHIKYKVLKNNMRGGTKDIEEIFEELNQLKQIIDSESEFKKTNMEERKQLIADYIRKYLDFKKLNPSTGTLSDSDTKLLKQIEELEREKTESIQKLEQFEKDKQQSELKLTELENKIKSILSKIFTESEVRTIFQ